jgi:hypothetical protein
MAMVRVLLIVGAVGGLTAWVIAQGTTNPAGPRDHPAAPLAPAAATEAVSRAATTRDPDFDVEISRLRARLGVMPTPSLSGRNPFEFGAAPSSRRASTSGHHSSALAPADAAEPDATPDRPPMQLLGVAADGSGAAPVRTAVIATPRQLYLVREGEQIALRFLVVRISDDAVELRDLVSDDTFPLALR